MSFWKLCFLCLVAARGHNFASFVPSCQDAFSLVRQPLPRGKLKMVETKDSSGTEKSQMGVAELLSSSRREKMRERLLEERARTEAEREKLQEEINLIDAEVAEKVKELESLDGNSVGFTSASLLVAPVAILAASRAALAQRETVLEGNAARAGETGGGKKALAAKGRALPSAGAGAGFGAVAVALLVSYNLASSGTGMTRTSFPSSTVLSDSSVVPPRGDASGPDEPDTAEKTSPPYTDGADLTYAPSRIDVSSSSDSAVGSIEEANTPQEPNSGDTDALETKHSLSKEESVELDESDRTKAMVVGPDISENVLANAAEKDRALPATERPSTLDKSVAIGEKRSISGDGTAAEIEEKVTEIRDSWDIAPEDEIATKSKVSSTSSSSLGSNGADLLHKNHPPEEERVDNDAEMLIRKETGTMTWQKKTEVHGDKQPMEKAEESASAKKEEKEEISLLRMFEEGYNRQVPKLEVPSDESIAQPAATVQQQSVRDVEETSVVGTDMLTNVLEDHDPRALVLTGVAIASVALAAGLVAYFEPKEEVPKPRNKFDSLSAVSHEPPPSTPGGTYLDTLNGETRGQAVSPRKAVGGPALSSYLDSLNPVSIGLENTNGSETSVLGDSAVDSITSSSESTKTGVSIGSVSYIGKETELARKPPSESTIDGYAPVLSYLQKLEVSGTKQITVTSNDASSMPLSYLDKITGDAAPTAKRSLFDSFGGPKLGDSYLDGLNRDKLDASQSSVLQTTVLSPNDPYFEMLSEGPAGKKASSRTFTGSPSRSYLDALGGGTSVFARKGTSSVTSCGSYLGTLSGATQAPAETSAWSSKERTSSAVEVPSEDALISDDDITKSKTPGDATIERAVRENRPLMTVDEFYALLLAITAPFFVALVFMSLKQIAEPESEAEANIPIDIMYELHRNKG